MRAFSAGSVAPTLAVVVVGSVAVGLVLSRAMLWLTRSICDVPTAIIIQFVGTFGVWLIADRLDLSPVLTMVTFAIAVARRAPAEIPARQRIPSYAVWESAVFVLNVLAFVFIGLQIRPIMESLDPDVRRSYLFVAGAVVVTVIVVRIVWVTIHNTIDRWWISRHGFHPARPLHPPTVGGALVVSWAGMRGIVSLAAALALPEGFPHRDLVVLTAFAVVLGTLVVQGLTLKPLMRALHLQEDDPVSREVEAARRRAVEAVHIALADDNASPAVRAVRKAFEVRLNGFAADGAGGRGTEDDENRLFRRALAAARRATFQMRERDEIGDDAFHRLEEQLDWMEMGVAGSQS
jgi:CPA1 family monovalent cation:H+ antiporter